MKKLFVAALAVLSLAACSNDEILDAPRSAAIKFDNAFVENATRAAADPSTNGNSINNFDVWAFVNESDGTVFNGENVTKQGNGTWSYDNTQYWAPENFYYFAALSPMDCANVTSVVPAAGAEAKLGLGEITFVNENGGVDLLYAKKVVETDDDINVVPDAVKLQFQHLLSKVKFTFTNGFTTDNVSIKVSDIRMTAPRSATINLAQADYAKAWVLGSEAVELAFGDVETLYTADGRNSAECAQERLTIPADANQVYTITFNVKVYNGVQEVMSVDKTSTVSNFALDMGNAYNFTAEVNPENLNMSDIEFDVEQDVEGWNPEDQETVAGTPVSNEAELRALFATNGGRGVLVNDIAIAQASNVAATRGTAGALVINEGYKVVLDLNGNNIFNATILNKGELSLINSDSESSKIDATDGTTIENHGTLTVEQNVYITNEDGEAVANCGAGKSDISNLVNTVEEMQTAINAAIDDYTVVLGADIVGNVTILQKAGVDLVIDGNGCKFDGVITVNGDARAAGPEMLTFKNINFATEGSDFTFINAPSKIADANGVEKYNYSHNVTIDNCTFTGNHTVGSASFTGTYNFVMKNSKATNMHSLLQVQSCDNNVLVDNVTVVGCKNGISFGNTANPTIKNSNITAAEYGIRADGNASRGNLIVENVDVAAKQPIVIRKVTTPGYNVTVDEETTLLPQNEGVYHVVFTSGSDDAEYVAPTVGYSINGADKLAVYPRDICVSTWEEFTAAIAAAPKCVKLVADITYDKSYDIKSNVILDLNGKSLEISDPVSMLNIFSNATVKNGTIKGKVYARTGADITFDGVTFGGTIANGGTEASLQVQGANVYAKDCSFNATNSGTVKSRPLSVEGRSSGTLKFENCSFKSNANQNQVYVNPLSGTATLDFTSCNFNNKTPNIMLAKSCPFASLTMTGTTKLSSVTLEINRAKEAVTEDDFAYLREMISNNSFSSVRLFYAGGSSEYIR